MSFPKQQQRQRQNKHKHPVQLRIIKNYTIQSIMSMESSNKIWGQDCTLKVEQIQEELNFPKSAAGWNKWTRTDTRRALQTMKDNGFEDHPNNCGYYHPSDKKLKFTIPVHPIKSGDDLKDEMVLEYKNRLWSYFNYDLSPSARHEEQSPCDHQQKVEQDLFTLLQRQKADLLTFVTDMKAESLADMDADMFSVIEAKVEEAKCIRAKLKAKDIEEDINGVVEDDDDDIIII